MAYDPPVLMQLRLQPILHYRICALAERLGISRNALIATLVDEGLRTREGIYTAHEMRTALANLEWLIRNRDATFFPDSDTVVVGDGGEGIDNLVAAGTTPATRDAKDLGYEPVA